MIKNLPVINTNVNTKPTQELKSMEVEGVNYSVPTKMDFYKKENIVHTAKSINGESILGAGNISIVENNSNDASVEISGNKDILINNKSVNKMIRNIDSLYGSYVDFESNSEAKYIKQLPVNSLSYTNIDKIGGHLNKCKNILSLNSLINPNDVPEWISYTDNSITIRKTDTPMSFFGSKEPKLKPNTDYTFWAKVRGNFAGRIYSMYGDSIFNKGDVSAHYGYTIRSDANGKLNSDKTGLMIFQNYTDTSINLIFYSSEVYIYDMILVEGSNIDKYEPYYNIIRESKPTMITTMTKNLWNMSDIPLKWQDRITYNVEDQTLCCPATMYSLSESFYKLPKPIPKDTELTLKVEVFSGRFTGPEAAITLGGYHQEEKFRRWECSVNLPKDTDLSNKTFIRHWKTFDTVTDFWIFFYQISMETDFKFRVMLSYGTTEFEWQPFKPVKIYQIPKEFLNLPGYGYGIGDKYNYIDFENNVYVQNIIRVDFKDIKTSDWHLYAPDGQKIFYCSIPNLEKTKGVEKSHILSAEYLTINSNAQYLYDKSISFGYPGYLGENKIAIQDKSFNNVEDFSNYINDKYIYCGLEEPIITPLPEGFFDNLLKTEPGGTIEFVNEYNYDIPNTITYEVKNND